jgi:hypothetical protein
MDVAPTLSFGSRDDSLTLVVGFASAQEVNAFLTELAHTSKLLSSLLEKF